MESSKNPEKEKILEKFQFAGGCARLMNLQSVAEVENSIDSATQRCRGHGQHASLGESTITVNPLCVPYRNDFLRPVSSYFEEKLSSIRRPQFIYYMEERWLKIVDSSLDRWKGLHMGCLSSALMTHRIIWRHGGDFMPLLSDAPSIISHMGGVDVWLKPTGPFHPCLNGISIGAKI